MMKDKQEQFKVILARLAAANSIVPSWPSETMVKRTKVFSRRWVTMMGEAYLMRSRVSSRK